MCDVVNARVAKGGFACENSYRMLFQPNKHNKMCRVMT